MKNSNRPSGPSQAKNEQRQAATEREEIDELQQGGDLAPQAGDSSRGARQAARDAHTNDVKADDNSSGGRRR